MISSIGSPSKRHERRWRATVASTNSERRERDASHPSDAAKRGVRLVDLNHHRVVATALVGMKFLRLRSIGERDRLPIRGEWNSQQAKRGSGRVDRSRLIALVQRVVGVVLLEA